MFESMSDGIAGLVGLALSLDRIPPCHISNKKCASCKEEISKDRKKFKEIFTYFAPCFLSFVLLSLFSCLCVSHVAIRMSRLR